MDSEPPDSSLGGYESEGGAPAAPAAPAPKHRSLRQKWRPGPRVESVSRLQEAADDFAFLGAVVLGKSVSCPVLRVPPLFMAFKGKPAHRPPG